MHRRARTPTMRSLTPDETVRVERLIDDFWPGRPVAQEYVEWNQYLIIEWQPGSGPVSQVTLPLGQLDEYRMTRPAPAAPVTDRPGPGYRDTANRKDTPNVRLSTAVPAG